MPLASTHRGWSTDAGPSRVAALALGLLPVVLLGTGLSSPAVAAEPAVAEPTTIYLVRHAEKDRNVKKDPPLTEVGRARADHLAHVLANAGIDAIYATPWKRTQQTAEPLAKILGLELRIDDTDDAHIERMVRILSHEHPGQQVLVVGHSNTVPELARALGARAAPDIPDHQNHDLYRLRLAPGTDGAEFTHLRYGAESKAPSTAPNSGASSDSSH